MDTILYQTIETSSLQRGGGLYADSILEPLG